MDFDSLNGFDKMHVRSGTSPALLSIPMNGFLNAVDVSEKGNLAINGYAGYVEIGFAFRTINHVYYGITNNGFITTLSLDEFSSMDEEVNKLLTDFNLLFVCWCRGMISSG